MGGYSATCAYCGRQYLRAAQLHAHKRGAHNVGGHRGGVPDRQDMTRPWAGAVTGFRSVEEARHALDCAARLHAAPAGSTAAAVAARLRAYAAPVLAHLEQSPTLLPGVYNPATGHVGCALLQAGAGGTPLVSAEFPPEQWELAPDPRQRTMAATLAQWRQLAAMPVAERVARWEVLGG